MDTRETGASGHRGRCALPGTVGGVSRVEQERTAFRHGILASSGLRSPFAGFKLSGTLHGGVAQEVRSDRVECPRGRRIEGWWPSIGALHALLGPIGGGPSDLSCKALRGGLAQQPRDGSISTAKGLYCPAQGNALGYYRATLREALKGRNSPRLLPFQSSAIPADRSPGQRPGPMAPTPSESRGSAYSRVSCS